jgi:hypothetical protein
MPVGTNCLNYEMYRRAKEPDLCCAVSEGSDFPSILGPNEWAYAEFLEAGQRRPPGFDEDAAAYACAVQGFYLFRWHGRRRNRVI